MLEVSRLGRAVAMAVNAHHGQIHSCGTPYVLHPLRVMDRLRDDGYNEDLQIIGVLHDVVEDTSVTVEEIKKEFGSLVADAIAVLTRHDDTPYEQYVDNIQNNPISYFTVPVKIADLKDNLKLGLVHPLPEPKHSRLTFRYKKALSKLTGQTIIHRNQAA